MDTGNRSKARGTGVAPEADRGDVPRDAARDVCAALRARCFAGLQMQELNLTGLLLMNLIEDTILGKPD